MEEIIERFEKETGLEFYTVDLDRSQELYTYDFVDWLIKQLPIHVVVKSSCDYWENNPQISSATSCKNCGKEKWEH